MIRVNGRATDILPAADRGLAYGDGVFRTLAVRHGRIVRWERQYAKLASDCARLGIPCIPGDLLRADVESVTGHASDAAVKIIVTRGNSERGYRPPADPHPNRIVMSSPRLAYPPRYAEEGVHVFLCRMRLGSQPALAGVKHLNRLENVLARAEWGSDDFAEGLLQDECGHAVSGTMSNLFIVEGDDLLTPTLQACGVAGLTRDLVIEAASAHGVKCAEASLPVERMMHADEVFLVNSLIGVWGVRSVGGTTLRRGRMVERVRTWLDEGGTTA